MTQFVQKGLIRKIYVCVYHNLCSVKTQYQREKMVEYSLCTFKNRMDMVYNIWDRLE